MASEKDTSRDRGEQRPAPARPVIAGSTLVLGSRKLDRPVLELGPREWARELAELRAVGFDAVDLVDSWLSPASMSDAQLDDLGAALDSCGLAVAGVSVIRRSVIDPVDGDHNLEFTLRSLEGAARLGAPIVGIGFHRPLTAAQKSSQFWMVPGPKDDRSDETWSLAIERIRLVTTRAAALGLDVTLELYEDTLLDSAAGAIRIIEGVGASNLGINPDIGNLIRVPGTLPAGWCEILQASLPYMNYWHVKNYIRLENPPAGVVLSYPTELAFGVIDYREALRVALAGGYAGPICIEHYEGDALGAIASGRRYLETLLCELQAAE